MTNSPTTIHAVLDSNVLVIAHRSTHSHCPNCELIQRWQAREFTFLFSRDTLLEYAEKLMALGWSGQRSCSSSHWFRVG